ncbi:hypothetical protein [Spirosoma koreense]
MVSEHQIIALLERLEYKIKQLKSVYDAAQNRVKVLEKANTTLRTRLQKKQAAYNELREKHVNSEKSTPISKDVGIIVKDNPSDTDTNADLKQQLDEYIRELERCIAHLSSLS